MHLNKLLSLFILFALSSCAFTYEEIRLTEESFDLIKIKQDDRSYEFELFEKEVKTNFRFEDKWYYWFDGHEIIKTEGGFDETLLHGRYSSFHENHQLESKGKFKRGLKKGKWRHWDYGGKLTHIESWRNGKLSKTRLLLEEDRAEFNKQKEKEKRKEEKRLEKERIKEMKKDSIKLIKSEEETAILNPK